MSRKRVTVLVGVVVLGAAALVTIGTLNFGRNDPEPPAMSDLSAAATDDPYLDAMQADLRRLMQGQGSCEPESPTPCWPRGYRTSDGITVSITGRSDRGWSAQATHRGTTLVCGLAVGDEPNPVDSTAQAGEVVCN
jgi:hypothetical protein